VRITPSYTLSELEMLSNWKPLENTSRKSSRMRRGSICRLMSEISLPMPGSISRNCPSLAASLSSPASEAKSIASGSLRHDSEPERVALPPLTSPA
jgi:hypothetical protein